jgi:hypothetical protein
MKCFVFKGDTEVLAYPGTRKVSPQQMVGSVIKAAVQKIF